MTKLRPLQVNFLYHVLGTLGRTLLPPIHITFCLFRPIKFEEVGRIEFRALCVLALRAGFHSYALESFS